MYKMPYNFVAQKIQLPTQHDPLAECMLEMKTQLSLTIQFTHKQRKN